jgi:hypothetical protein
MGNGGWYGTREEWERIEAPLKALDAGLERFAITHGLTVTKNHKDWPERSIAWGNPVRCLIQVYLGTQAQLTLNFWVCVSQDRGGDRYWRKEMLCSEVPASDVQARLPKLLETAKEKIDVWSAQPGLLEFATKLQA